MANWSRVARHPRARFPKTTPGVGLSTPGSHPHSHPLFSWVFWFLFKTAKKKMAVFQLLGVFPWGFRDQPPLSSLQKQPRCDKTSKVFFGRSFWTHGFAKLQLEVDWKTRRFFDKKNMKGLNYATMLCEFPIFLHSTGFLAPYWNGQSYCYYMGYQSFLPASHEGGSSTLQI